MGAKEQRGSLRCSLPRRAGVGADRVGAFLMKGGADIFVCEACVFTV